MSHELPAHHFPREPSTALPHPRSPTSSCHHVPLTHQGIITAFYRRLFSSEELKYFFVGLSTERLRTMQFRFMRYLLAGPGWYATTGGNMR